MKTKLPALIGVIPLPPLAGSPGAANFHPSDALRIAGLKAVNEAKFLAKAGVGGLILENHGDLPYYLGPVPPETIASFAIIAAAVRESVSIPLGIRVLGGDPRAALAIASVTSADFILVDKFGECAPELLRERARLGSEVTVLANSVPGESYPVGADGMSLEGMQTPERIHGAARIPTWLRNGVTLENLGDARKLGHGVIIDSAFRKKGLLSGELDSKNVRAWIDAVRASGKKSVKGKRRK